MAQRTETTHDRTTARNGRFDRGEPGRDRGEDSPDSPAELEKSDYKSILKRTLREFKDDELTDRAAALTYYGVLSLAPGLLVLTALLGLFGSSATQTLLDNLANLTPGPARAIFTQTIEGLQKSQAAGLALGIGVAAALWSASNYVGAFMRASNHIYEVEEGRPFWKLKPLQIAITAVMVVILAAIALTVVVSGPLAQTVGNVIGLGDFAVTVFNIAKWPVIAIVFAVMIACLYYIGPNVKHPKFMWVSPGGIFAVVGWILASALFALYVTFFPANKAYGVLGGVIIFLTWLWISNVVILLGAEMNAEMEREKKIQEGLPASQEPFLPLKDEPKKK
ncbi:MAG: YihY/virulence factor BrkB family protein [Actinomycetota bacterium]|nr:YihY/virulence factor BrkB family protein [Actinomycetota bacterium]